MVDQKISTLTPAGEIRKEFWLGFLEWPRLGESDRFLVGKHESEALSETNGDVVGRSKRGYHSIKHIYPGLVNERNGCLVGSVDDRLLRGAKTKCFCSYAPRRP